MTAAETAPAVNRAADSSKSVLVVGGGIGGLAAALALANAGVAVELAEQAESLGGHASQLACKAVQGRCAKCGACLVEAAAAAVREHPAIRLRLSRRVAALARPGRFAYALAPAHGDGPQEPGEADAVVLATGFALFDPAAKPYGFGRFPEVITNLELERRLRRGERIRRPADGAPLKRVAFIQCVGSRDANLGHPWCSTFCCAASLRAARLLRAQAPEPAPAVTVFYIDIQTFGRDFESALAQARGELDFVRAVPAEAYPAEGGGVRLAFVGDDGAEAREERFDLVVLAAGMVPSPETARLSGGLGLAADPRGYGPLPGPGVFTAGAARTPMTIAAAAADARRAAREALAWLSAVAGPPACGAEPGRGA